MQIKILQKTAILTLFLAIFQFAWSAKQIGIPSVKSYKTSQMQAGAQTWMIDINNKGIAYFANNDGVLEFDGIHWRKYPLPGGIIVRSVKTTDDGRVYAGGFNEFGYLAPDKNGELNYHSLTSLLPEEANDFGEVWRIYDLPVGMVFQSYEQLIIYKNNKIKIIEAPHLFHFSFLVNGELYIDDQENGIYRLSNDQIVKVPGLSKLAGQLIWAMIPKGKNILIATADNGIFEFNGLEIKEWKNKATSFLKKNQIYSGVAVNEKTYAFGTIQDGLLICDSSGNILQHINIDRGLQNNTVLSLKVDQYKNLWLGLDNGIDYIEINSPLTYFSEFNGISTGYAAIKHNGILYLGTNRGVFYHDWEKLMQGGGKQVFKLLPGTRGQVWSFRVFNGTLFCGHNSGIFTIKNNKAQLISDVQGGWTFIRPTNRNNIILCGTYTGLVKIIKKDGEWVSAGKLHGFKESSRYLTHGENQSLWMSHVYKGVYKIELTENCDSIKEYHLYGKKSGLPVQKNINVCTINGTPVFATGKGFYKFNSTQNHFEPAQNINKKFPNPEIKLINEDKAGNVWYFTENNAGVYRRQEDGSYVDVKAPFKELSGRFIKWFQFVYPLNENHVIFGLQDGFAYYTPQFPKNYQKPFNSFVRKVTITQIDSVIFCGHQTQEKFNAGIPHRYNQLKFEFAASDFENPEVLQFSTKLSEFDDEWSNWSSRSIREFTNLTHGEYTFNVRARNIFGKISETDTLHFEIYAPWYLSWWGYALYFTILVTFIYIMYRYVRYKTEKTKREEEAQQKRLFREREKQLQNNALRAEKEVIRERNERLRAEMKQKDKELANNTMQMIQKGKLLNSLKNDLYKFADEMNDDLMTHRIKKMMRKIDRELDTEKQWEVFEKHFESVHEEFLKRLKAAFPDLTPREMKLCAYLRLNISSKEIATLMNISTRGVEISRYRLRKKLQLSHETNLSEFIISF